MLFGYPEEAVEGNWLHEGLISAIETIHKIVSEGNNLPAWPLVFPDNCRDKLINRRGLRDRVDAYYRAVLALSDEQRAEVLSAMHSQNRISELLRCEVECAGLEELPPAIQESIRSLFDFAFDLLTDLGVRYQQYTIIYRKMRSRVCPFCGCEPFDHPSAPQEDFDHYLARSLYPFAAANLKNLVPMGHKCNAKYKLAKDILRRDDGSRRRAFYAYSPRQLKLSLSNSLIGEGIGEAIVKEWVVEFEPGAEEVETWDAVFSIRARYRRDVLDEENFKEWIWEFRNWCLEIKVTPTNDGEVIGAIESYERILASSGFNDRSFLKAAVFRFLHTRATVGCQRVLGLLRDAAGLVQ